MSEHAKQELERKEWCARLEQAVTDGRFLEDPAHWRAHVSGCATCRRTVEGVFLLRDLVGQARMNENLGDHPPLVGEEIVAEALSRHRAERQRLLTLWGMGVSVVVLVGGLFLFTRSPSGTPATARTHADQAAPAASDEAVAHAVELHRKIAPPGQNPDYDLLKRDAALREELLKALDHPSSFVRRMALWDLTSSGVPLEASRIEQFLTTFNETLDGPVVAAAVGADSAKLVMESLAARRTQTLRMALESAGTQVAQGGPPVRADAVTPFLAHADVPVRRAALMALQQDHGYVPGATEERLFARDDDVDVRADAGALIMARRGEEGAEHVIAHLRKAGDWALEQRLVPVLAGFQDGIAFARERTDDPATPLVPALLHALVLARKGERAAALRLVAKAVADGDVSVTYGAVTVAVELQLDEHREPLQRRWRNDQERWRASDAVMRRNVAEALVPWDEKRGGEKRLMWALDVIADFGGDPGPVLRKTLKRLADSSFQPVRARAEELLRSRGGG